MSNTTYNSDHRYPVFVPNQVLTSEDLNKLVQYFNAQTPLSHQIRSALIGHGIIKGMHVVTDGSAQEPVIGISTGMGLTPNGQTIALDQNVRLKYYKLLNNHVIELFNQTAALSRAAFDQAAFDQVTFDQALFDQGIEASEGINLSTISAEQINKWSDQYVMTIVREQKEVSRPSNLLNYEEPGKESRVYLRFFLISQSKIETINQSNESSTIFDFESRLNDANAVEKFIEIYSALYQESPIDPARIQQICEDEWMKLLPGLLNYLANRKNVNESKIQIQELLNNVKLQPSEFKSGLSDSIMPFSMIFPGIPQELINEMNYQGSLLTLIKILATYQKLFHTVSEFENNHHLSADQNQDTVNSLLSLVLGNNIASQFSFTPIKPTFLLLGAFNKSESVSTTLDRYRNYFIPALLETPEICQQIAHIHSLQDSLIEQCKGNAGIEQEEVKVTLEPGKTGNFYRIENHFGKSCREIQMGIRSSTSGWHPFDVIYLRLPEQPSGSEPRELFYRFTQAYPAMKHRGGVAAGGTFILVYVEKKNGSDEVTDEVTDEVIADFSLSDRIYPLDAAQLPVPPSLSGTHADRSSPNVNNPGDDSSNEDDSTEDSGGNRPKNPNPHDGNPGSDNSNKDTSNEDTKNNDKTTNTPTSVESKAGETTGNVGLEEGAHSQPRLVNNLEQENPEQGTARGFDANTSIFSTPAYPLAEIEAERPVLQIQSNSSLEPVTARIPTVDPPFVPAPANSVSIPDPEEPDTAKPGLLGRFVKFVTRPIGYG